jgi:hypothetical protein
LVPADDATGAAAVVAQISDAVVAGMTGTVFFIGNDALWQSSFPTERPGE